jgi:crotonobetainyl-CoA:carnitine CoA-transferase CaiB-like acyl-CoA transferase
MKRPPLTGVRILCLAEQYPGPYATLLLADLGAEVIIVERPGGGDPARLFPSFHGALNRNKRSLALDLKDEVDRARLFRLVETADVFMEGFRPGTISRLGFGPETLRAAHPRLVYVSISGFGQDGPYRDRPAHDLSYQAAAGLLSQMTGTTASTPPSDIAIGDLSSGLFAALGIVTALFDRTRTGQGTYLDVSMTDGLVSLMSVFLGAALNGGEIADIGAEPAYALFTCSDGLRLSLSIAHEDFFWRALCGLLDLPAHADLRRTERVRRAELLRADIAAALARRPRDHWGSLLDRAGIPWGPVNSLDVVVADPHFAHRGLFVAAAEDTVTGARYVRQPLLFDGEAFPLRRGVPALGEADRDYR